MFGQRLLEQSAQPRFLHGHIVRADAIMPLDGIHPQIKDQKAGLVIVEESLALFEMSFPGADPNRRQFILIVINELIPA